MNVKIIQVYSNVGFLVFSFRLANIYIKFHVVVDKTIMLVTRENERKVHAHLRIFMCLYIYMYIYMTY